MTAELAGFATRQTTFGFDGGPRRIELDLEVGSLQETVTVRGDSPVIDQAAKQSAAPPSQNVVNLQARAAGVLPIRVDVPRAGTSHEFIKPLVVGDSSHRDVAVQKELMRVRVRIRIPCDSFEPFSSS
jgi:hypothetical protein